MPIINSRKFFFYHQTSNLSQQEETQQVLSQLPRFGCDVKTGQLVSFSCFEVEQLLAKMVPSGSRILCLLVLAPVLVTGLRCARTSTDADSPQKDKACVYPFIVNNKINNNCTRDHDGHERAWCSTKVDENGHHVIGQNEWGYCDSGWKSNSICSNLS